MSDTTLQSHMPILRWLLATFRPMTALEFGCGFYSTPLLVRQCLAVRSIEMNDQAWLTRVHKYMEEEGIFNGNKNWSGHWMDNPWDAWKEVMEEPIRCADQRINHGRFDLVLVDGHGDSRHLQANCMVGHSSIIVIHDSQHEHTHGQLAHHGYTRVDFKDFRKPYMCAGVWPWTTVLVNDLGRAKVIADWRDAG